MAARVRGPTFPSTGPTSRPRFASRLWSSLRSELLNIRSCRGQSWAKGGPSRSRSRQKSQLLGLWIQLRPRAHPRDHVEDDTTMIKLFASAPLSRIRLPAKPDRRIARVAGKTVRVRRPARRLS
jgi:hypothetical protein